MGKRRLPSVMVLMFKPELTHSVWVDFQCRSRTMRGLMLAVQREVNSGRAVGFRLMRVETERLGRVTGKKINEILTKIGGAE